MKIQQHLPHRAWLLLACFATSASAFAATPQEQSLFSSTNAVRGEQGLPALRWDDALARAARTHLELMMTNPQISHQYPGEADLTSRAAQAGAHFQAIAENIAMGPSVDSVQKQWMKSAPHRANILDPNLNAVGFAVIERSGYYYAVADFDRMVANLSAEQVEQSVGKLLLAQGVQPNGPSQDARQTCEMNQGTAGGSSPLFVMRWQNSDLSELPGALQERLRSGKYRTAAVGACSSAHAESGFTSYRVAVLLY